VTNSPFDLSEKTAVVTGGNKGIGKGIAVALADAGASVTLTGRDEPAGHATVSEIAATGGSATFVACDVNDASAMADLLNNAARTGNGTLDVLVNNAGISKLDGPPEEMSDDTWQSVIDTNLTSVFKCCRTAHSLMQANGGKIINIGSMYSLFGTPLIPNYAASKGAIVQLTKSLATAWAASNIQVNSILPGWISTDLTAAVEADAAFSAQIVARTPAGRFGVPDDLGGTAVFLASSASDFVTGQNIAVCGGYSVS